MITISVPPINIPAITVIGNGLQVTMGSPYMDSTISISYDSVKFQCILIMREEMAIMRKNAYETVMDYERLQIMLDSGDEEMRNLMYTTLNKYTKYCSRILEGIRISDRYRLETVIKEYIDANSRNITEKVK